MLEIDCVQGEWLRQGLTYDIGEYIVGELESILDFCLYLSTRFISFILSFFFYLGYIAPDPPVFSGQHRYMVFLYEQLEHEIEVPQPEGRAKFDPIQFFETIGGEDTVILIFI